MKKALVFLLVLGLAVSALAIAGCGEQKESSTQSIFKGAQDEASKRVCEANQRMVDAAIQMYQADKEQYPTSMTQLAEAQMIQSVPTCPAAGPYQWVPGDPPYIKCKIADHNMH